MGRVIYETINWSRKALLFYPFFGRKEKIMLYLMYVGEQDTKYVVDFGPVSDHVVQVTGDFPVKGNGFILSRLDCDDNWDYTGFRTVYKNVDGGAQFSDDGSVYVPPLPVVTFTEGPGGTIGGEKSQAVSRYEDLEVPLPIPGENFKFIGWEPVIPDTGVVSGDMTFEAKFEPVPMVTFTAGDGGTINGEKSQAVDRYEDLVIPSPVPGENYKFEGWEPEIPDTGAIDDDTSFQAKFTYVETLAEVKARKIMEMNTVQQAAIQEGVNVILTDGSVEHFTLTEYDQTSLMGLQAKAMSGMEKIPWHTSDQSEHCKYYSKEDMLLITEAAMGSVTYHVTYYRDLRIYINSLEDRESVEAVTYGMVIPEEYRSEVLADIYAAQEAQQGV